MNWKILITEKYLMPATVGNGCIQREIFTSIKNR